MLRCLLLYSYLHAQSYGEVICHPILYTPEVCISDRIVCQTGTPNTNLATRIWSLVSKAQMLLARYIDQPNSYCAFGAKTQMRFHGFVVGLPLYRKIRQRYTPQGSSKLLNRWVTCWNNIRKYLHERDIHANILYSSIQNLENILQRINDFLH